MSAGAAAATSAAGSDPCTAEVLRTAHELEALAGEWVALWEADPRATPFQRPEWLLPWWRQFGQPGLRAVTVRRGGKLVGLLPLYIYHHPGGERQLLLVGAGTSDYLDGVFAPECEADAVDRALALLAREPDWDVAQLTQLLPHSPVYAALQRRKEAVAYSGDRCLRCPAVPVAGLPPKVRAEVRYCRNYARAGGPLTLEVADGGTCASLLEELVRLHTGRWQQAGEPGVLADPRVLAAHREAVPLLQQSGLLRLLALRSSGEAIAVLYSLLDPPGRSPRVQYFYLSGFSPAHARWKPGTLLTALAMEHAVGQGVATVDMLRGSEPYKKFWHAVPVPTYGFALPRTSLAEPGRKRPLE